MYIFTLFTSVLVYIDIPPPVPQAPSSLGSCFCLSMCYILVYIHLNFHCDLFLIL